MGARPFSLRERGNSDRFRGRAQDLRAAKPSGVKRGAVRVRAERLGGGRRPLRAPPRRPSTAAAPALALRDGQVLVDSSNAEVGRALGVETELGPGRDFDVTV